MSLFESARSLKEKDDFLINSFRNSINANTSNPVAAARNNITVKLEPLQGQSTQQLPQYASIPNKNASAQSSEIQSSDTDLIQSVQIEVSAGMKRSAPQVVTEEQRQRSRKNKQLANDRWHKTVCIERISNSGQHRLTKEQIHILRTCNSPSAKPIIVRVTAAAGTGKTSTIVALAELAANLGHKRIIYVTFNKAAATDAQDRLQHVPQVRTKTFHSLAHRDIPLLSDSKVREFVDKKFGKNINQFLVPFSENLSTTNNKEKREGKYRRARNRVLKFLTQSLDLFCQSDWTYSEFADSNNEQRVLYSARYYHESKGEEHGFEKQIYCRKDMISWYADTAAAIWKSFPANKTSFARNMKLAHLGQIKIDATCILVDESQDCDACQIAWIEKQVEFGAQVYFVGDAAQTIYTFRGAKSENLMKLDVKEEHRCTLTRSWRFGDSIARIANLVLFSKEYSRQTTQNNPKLWEPYRVEGSEMVNDQVCVNNIFNTWETQKVTVIARRNDTLIIMATKFFDICNGPDTSGITEIKNRKMPKFHINGNGKSSGPAKMFHFVEQADALFELFLVGGSDTDVTTISGTPEIIGSEQALFLDPKLFPEFKGREVTWTEFCSQVDDDNLTDYVVAIYLIEVWKTRTRIALRLFIDNVLDKKHTADEADIILTTCHAGEFYASFILTFIDRMSPNAFRCLKAKGMEWDNVYVCEDFIDLCVKPSSTTITHGSQARILFQFSSSRRGDDLNMLYVACTRAKKLLRVPEDFVSLLSDCDTLCSWVNEDLKRNAIEDSGKEDMADSRELPPPVWSTNEGSSLSTVDAYSIFYDIVQPLRFENGQLEMNAQNANLSSVFLKESSMNISKESIKVENIYHNIKEENI
jgi:hypothetical protein